MKHLSWVVIWVIVLSCNNKIDSGSKETDTIDDNTVHHFNRVLDSVDDLKIVPPKVTTLDSNEKNWKYHDSKDKISGSKTHQAKIETTITNPDLPPSQIQQGVIVITDMDGRTGVLLMLRKAHFKKNEKTGDFIYVRFDDNESELWPVDRTYDSTSLYIDNVPYFIPKLKKSKRVIFYAPIVDKGEINMEFHVAGLVWK